MYRQQTDEKLHQSIYWVLLGQQKLENEKSNKRKRKKESKREIKKEFTYVDDL